MCETRGISARHASTRRRDDRHDRRQATLLLAVRSTLVTGAVALLVLSACSGETTIDQEATRPSQTSGRVAFVSNRDGNDEIYVVNADGTGLRNLTNNPASDTDPTWSPDGSRIAFWSDRDNEWGRVYVMNADGSGVERLTDEPPGSGLSIFDPLWAPDGTKIAFSSGGSGFYGIYVMNPDGAEPTLVSEETDDWIQSWSPDSKKIAFVGGQYGDDLFVVNADGTGLKALTTSGDFSGYGGIGVSWSADSRTLVCERSGDIVAINVDGSGEVNLTESSKAEAFPYYAPDGSRIAFFSDRDDQIGEIYTMKPDGSSIMRLTQNTAIDAAVAWSPDGSQILFVSNRDSEDGGDLYVMNADGTEQRRVTTGGSGNGRIAWSPVR